MVSIAQVNQGLATVLTHMVDISSEDRDRVTAGLIGSRACINAGLLGGVQGIDASIVAGVLHFRELPTDEANRGDKRRWRGRCDTGSGLGGILAMTLVRRAVIPWPCQFTYSGEFQRRRICHGNVLSIEVRRLLGLGRSDGGVDRVVVLSGNLRSGPGAAALHVSNEFDL